MIRLQSLVPNLMVKNVNETLDFYVEVLGFEVLQTVPEAGTLEWGFVKFGDVKLMFQETKSIREEYTALETQQEGGALTLYIRVENLEEWYVKIKDKTNMIKSMNKTFYGANEFAIMDPNGFILTFSDILE